MSTTASSLVAELASHWRDSGAPTLEGRKLNRVFGKGEMQTFALRDVTVQMYPGEITLLMGPSGSGKSTLLAVLSGLLKPNSGQVIAAGHDFTALSPSEQERFRLRYTGFIFQGYNLFSSLTASQQLEMVLRWGEGAGRAEAKRRAAEMLTLLGLARKAHLRPNELSGGEKQRVAIGRALVKNPMFCFADEPTSALDWENGKVVLDELRNAARDRGTTVLVVSHDRRIVDEGYPDRVFEMEDGYLREQLLGPREHRPEEAR